MSAHQPVERWPTKHSVPRGFGCSLFGNLGVALVFFGVGVLTYGYGGEDGLTGHPTRLLTATGIALTGSVIAAVVFLSRPGARQFGAGVLGGALVAVLVEFGALATYLVQIVETQVAANVVEPGPVAGWWRPVRRGRRAPRRSPASPASG